MSCTLYGRFLGSVVEVTISKTPDDGRPCVLLRADGPNATAALNRFEIAKLIEALTIAKESMDGEETLEQLDEKRGREGSR